MKNTSKIWLTIGGVLVGGAAVVWGYGRFVAATTIQPGAMSIAAPSSGNINLALPSGAKGWVVALVGTTTTSVPSGTGHFAITVAKGMVVTVTWNDSSGTLQTTIINFT